MLTVVLIGLLIQNVICDENVEKANEFMDNLLQDMKTDKSTVYSLDPLSIDDMKESRLKMTDVTVKGLSKLIRNEDCKPAHLSNLTTLISCHISARNLLVTFNYEAPILWSSFRGEALVKIDQILAKLQIVFFNGEGRLDLLRIEKLGDFHVEKINGLSFLFNWILRLVAERFLENSRSKITSALHMIAKKALDDVLSKKLRRFEMHQ